MVNNAIAPPPLLLPPLLLEPLEVEPLEVEPLDVEPLLVLPDVSLPEPLVAPEVPELLGDAEEPDPAPMLPELPELPLDPCGLLWSLPLLLGEAVLPAVPLVPWLPDWLLEPACGSVLGVLEPLCGLEEPACGSVEEPLWPLLPELDPLV